MGQFSRTFKVLNTQIRGSPSQNLPLTLSILDDLILAQELLDQSLIPKEFIETIRRELGGVEREAKSAGAIGVGDVIEDVKRRGQAITILPSDGGLIELTTDVFHPNKNCWTNE
jgi:hypothetical protein